MLSRKLFTLLYIISTWALIRPHSASSTLFNNLLELFLMIMVFLNLRKIHKKIFFVFSITLLYFFLSVTYILLFTQSNILDFLLIYKFFVYAIFLSIIFKKQIISKEDFFYFYKFLLSVFALKYLAITIFNSSRPTLFFENNFELMMLALMFYLYYAFKGKVSIRHQVLISIIFVLSKSISGVLILMFVLMMVNIKQILKKIYIIIPGFIALVLAAIYILKDRMGGEIDFSQHTRFRFLIVFLDEIKNWNFSNYLFGAPRISHLSEEACEKLGYWDSLFSYSGDGTCYSVVLHSYIFRSIFDHGFLGLLFILYFVYTIILRSGFTRNDGLAVLGIVLINGLSVSSFNSVYFAMGMLFYLITKNSNVEQRKSLA